MPKTFLIQAHYALSKNLQPTTHNLQPTTYNFPKKGCFSPQKTGVFPLFFLLAGTYISRTIHAHTFTNLNHLQLHQNVKNSTPKQENMRQRPVSHPCRNCKIRLRLRNRNDVQHTHAVLALRATHPQTKTLRAIRLSRRS